MDRLIRMSRRAAIALTALVAVLVPALTPWTISSSGLSAALAGQIKREYGLDLTVSGPIVVSILPMPRVKLSSVAIGDPDGRFSIEAGQFKGVLRLASLLAGHARITDARIVGADIRIDPTRLPAADLGAAAAALRQKLEASPGSLINRVVIASSRIALSRGEAEPVVLWPKFEAVLRWPDKADLDLTASAIWNGETFTVSVAGLNVARLLSGQPEGVEIAAVGRPGTVRLLGDVTLKDGMPRFSGFGAVETPSIGAFARWSGLARDFAEVDRPAGISGDCVIDASGVEWPQVTMAIGDDRLEGSLAVLTGGARPQVRATLAGGNLDLSWILPIADPERAVPPPTDYDVRLSASLVRMGPVRLTDVASGILIRGDRLEVSLARASLAEGSVRGRLSAVLDGDARDFRGQLTLDGLRAERLSAETGMLRGVSGLVGLQANLEAAGDRQPDLVRSLRGKVSVVARDGEIAGLSLAALASRPEGAGMDRRGRMRFGRASLALDVAGGSAEITDGRIESLDAETRMTGRLSLIDGVLAVTATTQPAKQDGRTVQPIVLDFRGPIAAPSVVNVQSTGAITPAQSSR